ncbi:MAG: NAD(P)-dependent oxidoreductase [Nitrospirae bacterium]|nr:NAD(P)-dependent oxidoreductase [Candidatus Manganitrophaceae bacterium]
MSGLKGKTIVITGGSRGIGKAIGLRAARDGANIILLAKTVASTERLPGTVFSAAEEMIAAGGRALACPTDIRSEEQVASAIKKGVETFGGIDILVNNASALGLTGTLQTPMKRFDLMQQVNVRGTFLCAQAALPHLVRSANPHILTLAPPLNLDPKWFAPHLAYSLSKFGMSLCTLGLAEEFKANGVAVNALWPRTAIATAAVKNLLGGDAALRGCRSPEIMADAAHVVLTRPSRDYSGNFFVDEDLLRVTGITDFDRYAISPGAPLLPDFFV